MKFNNYRHHVGNSLGNVTFGYTKRTGGTSPYPSGAFNMALYIDDDIKNIHHHQDVLASHIGFPRKIGSLQSNSMAVPSKKSMLKMGAPIFVDAQISLQE
ncbi:hypothetical protein [Salinicoccus sp. CNSTN-B1]